MLAPTLSDHYIRTMCGRVIQSSGPLRYSIVDGMTVRDSRVLNYGRGGMQRPSGASPNRRSPARDLGVHVTTQLLCIRQPATG